jgi:hypothetical protein
MFDIERIYNIDISDYTPIIDAFGDVVLRIDSDGYQGDTWVLYEEWQGGRFYKIGYLEFGWGSCSGCDALQACNSFDDLHELVNELYQSIIWFDDAKSALDWFRNHDWEGDWSANNLAKRTFVSMAKVYLIYRAVEQEQ